MKAFDDFLASDLAHARKLYSGDGFGVLVLHIDERVPGPPVATASILEHRPLEARQHVYTVGRDPVPRRLAPGPYTVTVTALGYEPYRAHVDVVDGQVVELTAQFEKPAAEAASFHEILGRYHIRADEHHMRDLSIAEGTTVVLDASSREFAKHRHEVRVSSIARAKEVFGVPDKHWPGDAPRFGRHYTATAEPGRADRKGATPAARAAFREYIWGNSRSVSNWAGVLDSVLENDPLLSVIYALPNIDVGAKATLRLNNVGLLCNTLSVHITGQVIVSGKGPTRIEMNRYQLYGLGFQIWPHLAELTAASFVNA
jgi:hypothetical protein